MLLHYRKFYTPQEIFGLVARSSFPLKPLGTYYAFIAAFILTSHLHYFDRDCFSTSFHRIIVQFKWGEIRRFLVQFSVQSIYLDENQFALLFTQPVLKTSKVST